MAKRVRYEFTTNWLAEQGFRRSQGLGKPDQVHYTPVVVDAEQAYYEQMQQDSLLYDIMERGIR